MKTLRQYCADWWTIMIRPIYFYTFLQEENWQKDSLSFLLVTAWLLAFCAAAAIFIIQLVPMGAPLVAGITGLKYLIILPVLIALALAFFLIIFLILGGMLVVGVFVALALIGLVLHCVYSWLGGQGSLNSLLQKMFYSSAALLPLALLFVFMFLTKKGVLDFSLFRTGYYLLYTFVVVYAYGLWAIIGRKTYGVDKTKAFLGALVPVIVLLIFGFLFDKIALSRLVKFLI